MVTHKLANRVYSWAGLSAHRSIINWRTPRAVLLYTDALFLPRAVDIGSTSGFAVADRVAVFVLLCTGWEIQGGGFATFVSGVFAPD